MSDEWDFYFFEQNDRPASIFVDLGISGDAPISGYPISACLCLDMRSPRHDGLSSNAEYDTLIEIEDALGNPPLRAMLYVGRLTAGGRRDLYFYTSDPTSLEAALRERMAAFPGYAWRFSHRPDPEWRVYVEFLHPDEEQRHSISNRSVCDNLQQHGDELVASREIDHWAYFPDPAARDAFLARAALLGYGVRETHDPDQAQDRYAARVFREDVPAHAAIDATTHPLIRFARELGGDYDGWETFVVKPD